MATKNEIKAGLILAGLVLACLAGKMTVNMMASGGIDGGAEVPPVGQQQNQQTNESDKSPEADTASSDPTIATTTKKPSRWFAPWRPRRDDRSEPGNSSDDDSVGKGEGVVETEPSKEEKENDQAQAVGKSAHDGLALPGLELHPIGVSYLCLAKEGHLALMAMNEKGSSWVRVKTCPPRGLPEVEILDAKSADSTSSTINDNVISKRERSRLLDAISAHDNMFFQSNENLSVRYFLSRKLSQQFVQAATAYDEAHPPDSNGGVRTLVVEIDAQGRLTIKGVKP